MKAAKSKIRFHHEMSLGRRPIPLDIGLLEANSDMETATEVAKTC